MKKPDELLDVDILKMSITELRSLERKLVKEIDRFRNHGMETGRGKAKKSKFNLDKVRKRITVLKSRGEVR